VQNTLGVKKVAKKVAKKGQVEKDVKSKNG